MTQSNVISLNPPTQQDQLRSIHDSITTILARLSCASAVLDASSELDQCELECRAVTVIHDCVKELDQMHTKIDAAIVGQVSHG